VIQAIETVYNGYRFRSRLEARWAVFFDALGVRWEYEKEGYTDGALRYLPDFWLPDLDCWVEIKPGISSGLEPDREAWNKAALLVAATHKHVYIMCGAPCDPDEEGSYQGFVVEDGNWGDNTQLWGSCPVCDVVGIGFCAWVERMPCSGKHDGLHNKFDCATTHKVMLAYTAARQARFEYGESGYRH
jgi:hypothetical protein